MSFSQAMSLLSIKGVFDPPFAVQDGTGFVSSPDWSMPQSLSSGHFKSFRQHWMSKICVKACTNVFWLIFQQGTALQYLAEIQTMRDSLTELLTNQRLPTNWNIPDHQPLTLHIMDSLSRMIHDPDKELFHHLIQGVPTGFKQDIPPSHCFAAVDRDEDVALEPLSVHMSSWKSVLDDEAITDELAQTELDKGWIEPFPGNLQEFQDANPEVVRLVNWEWQHHLQASTACGRQYSLWPESELFHSGKAVCHRRKTQSDVTLFALPTKKFGD